MSSSPQQFGPFLLEARIGRGGMAEVWRARRADAAPNQPPSAVKRLLPAFAKGNPGAVPYLDMMADEARLLQTLDHPSIVRVLGQGEIDGLVYTELELVEGTDLFGLLQLLHARNLTMPPAFAAYVIAQVCHALDHAHKRTDASGAPLGIIHRDVSPQNVLCSWRGGIKLTDFGVARATVRQAVTDAGLIKGKVYYMAPEQLVGQQLDARADQFAAGILLYECLTAEPLYQASEPKLLHQQVAEARHTWPDAALRRVPATLREVADRALQRRADDRFIDCAAMATALRSATESLGPTVGSAMFGGWLRQLHGVADPDAGAAGADAAVTQAIDAAVLQARLRPPPRPAPLSRPATPRPATPRQATPQPASPYPGSSQSASPRAATPAPVTLIADPQPAPPAAAPPPPRPRRGPSGFAHVPGVPPDSLDAPASPQLLLATAAVWLAAATAVLLGAWWSRG